MAAPMDVDAGKVSEGPGDLSKLKPGKFAVSQTGRPSDSPYWEYFCEYKPGYAVCLVEKNNDKPCGAEIKCEGRERSSNQNQTAQNGTP